MNDSRDELQLVLLAQCGDTAALESLLLGIQGRLSRYVSGFIGRESAEDVLQECFVRIWQNLKWLRRPELFRPWAYRIASRICYEHLKQARRQWPEPVALEEMPAARQDRSELVAGLDAVLERVSPASRAVLLLHYGEDLTIEEAAAVLDISVGTAKSRLAYGLSCLRERTRKDR